MCSAQGSQNWAHIFARATSGEVLKSRITRLSPSSRQLRLKQRQLRNPVENGNRERLDSSQIISCYALTSSTKSKSLTLQSPRPNESHSLTVHKSMNIRFSDDLKLRAARPYDNRRAAPKQYSNEITFPGLLSGLSVNIVVSINLRFLRGSVEAGVYLTVIELGRVGRDLVAEEVVKSPIA